MQLYGYVFDWDGFELDPTESNRASFDNAISKVPTLSVRKHGQNLASKKWSILSFRSNKPLLGEAETDDQLVVPGSEPRFYPVYVRVNDKTKTVILASLRYAITDATVAAFNAFATPNLRRRVINIETLSSHLFSLENDKKFFITYYMADVPGYGSALNTISLYGEDIGSADFLTEERKNFTARQIGVRTISSRHEAGRFSNLGALQFRLESISDLEKFLSFTYSKRLYIE